MSERDAVERGSPSAGRGARTARGGERRAAPRALALTGALLATAALAACAGRGNGEPPASTSASAEPRPDGVYHVPAKVQATPGGPHVEMEMGVHPAPEDLPTRAADEVDLDDDELVLGVVVDGQPVAYPVRYLALSEVTNDRVGETPIAPSW